MKLHATNWRCDACGHVDRYNNPTIPKGWVQANIAEVDETKRGGGYSPARVPKLCRQSRGHMATEEYLVGQHGVLAGGR